MVTHGELRDRAISLAEEAEARTDLHSADPAGAAIALALVYLADSIPDANERVADALKDIGVELSGIGR